MKFIRTGEKMTVTGHFTVVTANGILPLKGCIGVVTQNRLEDKQVLVSLLIGNTQYEIPLSMLTSSSCAANKNVCLC